MPHDLSTQKGRNAYAEAISRPNKYINSKAYAKMHLKSKMDVRVNQEVDKLFEEAHQFAKTKSGDTTPSQAKRLDKIKQELKDLIVEQTLQNL